MKTSKLFLALSVLTGAILLAGCETTPDSRISNNPTAFAQLTAQEQTLVKSGQVGVGFSEMAVKLALGEPNRVTLETNAQGQIQIWHYSESVYYDGAYLYGGTHWGGWGHRRSKLGIWRLLGARPVSFGPDQHL